MGGKKSFSITDYVKPEQVSNLDTPPAAGQVVEIPLNRIFGSEKNFYDTSNVTELVKSIELNGLIEPIIVRPIVLPTGKTNYEIISGHRRYKAYESLHAEKLGGHEYAAIPAIVRETKNEIVAELLLIEANRATRVMSSADTAKQAERYKDLLVQLKESGVVIPGRLRDIVAEAMQISASRLARLDVIRKGLIPEWEEKWEHGKLNESAAYELAKISKRNQQLMIRKDGQKLTSSDVQDLSHFANNCFDGHECKADKTAKCDHGDEFWKVSSGKSSCGRCVPGSWSSRGQCCADCKKFSECKSACQKALPLVEKQIKQQKAEAEARKKTEMAEDKKAGHKWAKLVALCEAGGATQKEIAQAIGMSTDSLDKYTQGIFERYTCYKDPSNFGTQRLMALSKLAGVSINKLLGMKNADNVKDEDPPEPTPNPVPAPAVAAPDTPIDFNTLDKVIAVVKAFPATDPEAPPQSGSPSADCSYWRPITAGLFPDEPPSDGQLCLVLCSPGNAAEQYRAAIWKAGSWFYHKDPYPELMLSNAAAWLPIPARHAKEGAK
jgi:ParB/RepB/Spo0J family partition protein